MMLTARLPFALFSLQPHLLLLFSQSSFKTISKVGSNYNFKIHFKSHFGHWYFQYFHFVSESLLRLKGTPVRNSIHLLHG